MDSSSAKMTCTMTANMECEKCRLKVYEVLINVHGTYSIDIDAEQGTVKVSGKVNPKIILQLLGGNHAKIKSVKFDNEEPSPGGGYPPYSYPPHSLPPYGMGHHPYSYPYPTGGPYDYPMMMPPGFMMPPPPPPSSAAALPQPTPTLLLGATPQKSGAAEAPKNSGSAPPPQNSGAAAQSKSSVKSAPPNGAKEAVIPTDKASKSGGSKQCSIIRWARKGFR